MILPQLPALELLTLQRVSKTWYDIINDRVSQTIDSKIIRMKLFLEQDPPDNSWGKAFGGSGLRWNPFLEKYGTVRTPQPESHDYRVRIKRKELRKPCPDSSLKQVSVREFSHISKPPQPSWKKMYVSYPTKKKVRVELVPHPQNLRRHEYRSGAEEEARMEFLTKNDKKCKGSQNDFFQVRAEW